MALTSEEIQILRSRLREAEDAYHLLLTGQSVVKVIDQSGESQTYTTASASRLDAYIARLKAQIAGIGTTAVSGPMRPVFK